MKQVLQRLDNGEIAITEVPDPKLLPGVFWCALLLRWSPQARNAHPPNFQKESSSKGKITSRPGA